MGDAKSGPRRLHKRPAQVLAIGECNRVHQHIQPSVSLHRFREPREILFFADVAVKYLCRSKLYPELLHRLLLALALIGQQQLGPFAPERLGDGVSDAPLICHAQNQRRLSRKKL